MPPTRTWTYGERKTVRVLSVEIVQQMIVIAALETERPFEGHVIVNAADVLPRHGDVGVIEFRHGGPTGGHWAFVEISAKRN
jgi:hypothetical protein